MEAAHLTSVRFDQRVEEFRLDLTEKATGFANHWMQVGTWWASVVELDTQARVAFGRLDTQVTHQLQFRGRRDFSFSATLFRWAGRVLRPTGARYLAGGRRGGFTVITARDITDDGRLPSLEGSGSGS